eukprot:350664-Chlamydomonas_euryale.AAC.1
MVVGQPPTARPTARHGACPAEGGKGSRGGPGNQGGGTWAMSGQLPTARSPARHGSLPRAVGYGQRGKSREEGESRAEPWGHLSWRMSVHGRSPSAVSWSTAHRRATGAEGGETNQHERDSLQAAVVP